MRFRDTLILFAKTPRICRVKTRMWPTLSHRQCLYFHRQATDYLYQSFAKKKQFNIKIYTTNKFMRVSSLLPKEIEIQQGIDLGARMHQAMCKELQNADRVMVIGSDCISLNTDYVHACFEKLTRQKDLVLGKANDGGYVLIGARNVSQALFNNTQWGTSCVLNETSSNAKALGYHVHVMPELIDADTVDDLKEMAKKNILPSWALPLLTNS